jgi:CheY-like chemotaxis protein
MPVMDGWEFLAHKAEKPEIAGIPIIISTGNPERAPPDMPVLRKPLEPQTLIEIVNQYCRAP